MRKSTSFEIGLQGAADVWQEIQSMIRFTDEQRQEFSSKCLQASKAMAECSTVVEKFPPAMSGFAKNEASGLENEMAGTVKGVLDILKESCVPLQSKLADDGFLSEEETNKLANGWSKNASAFERMARLSTKLAKLMQSDGMDAYEAIHFLGGKFQSASAYCSVVASILTDISIENTGMTDGEKRDLVNSVLDQYNAKTITKEQMEARLKEFASSSGDFFFEQK